MDKQELRKQELEQAAREYAEKHGEFYPRGCVTTRCYERGFIAGAEWQRERTEAKALNVFNSIKDAFNKIPSEI